MQTSFDPNLAHSGLDRITNIEQWLQAKDPDGNWMAADHGFATWAYDPALPSTGITTVNGSAYFTALQVRTTVTVSKLWYGVANAASTATSGENLVGLYQASGASATQMASVASDTLFTTAGVASASFSALTLSPGIYYVCTMGNATTPAHLAIAAVSTTLVNAGLSTAGLRFFSNTSGNTTTIPASITLSSNAAAGSIWAALS